MTCQRHTHHCELCAHVWNCDGEHVDGYSEIGFTCYTHCPECGKTSIIPVTIDRR